MISQEYLRKFNKAYELHTRDTDFVLGRPPNHQPRYLNTSNLSKLAGTIILSKPTINELTIAAPHNMRTEKHTRLEQAICKIYFLCFNYEKAARSSGVPRGVGILLYEGLCLTVSSVLPKEETARCSHAQFFNGEVYSFDYMRCLMVIEHLSISLVSLDFAAQASLRYIQPHLLSHEFILKSKDTVYIVPFQRRPLQVIQVNENFFTLSSGLKEQLVPGTPIYATNWELQGMLVHSVDYMHTAVRMDKIMSYFEDNATSLLERLLHIDYLANAKNIKNKFSYYFQWGGQRGWKFDIEKEEWQEAFIRNSRDFDPDWSFNKGHRLVYMPDNTVLILGGRTSDGVESFEVLEYNPFNFYSLTRFPSMLEPRDGPTCLVVKDFIYALGGKPNSTSCEKYSLKTNRWIRIAKMFYGRTEAAACTGQQDRFIFIFGGQPLNPSGSTVERYSLEFNHWELLSVTLPRPNERLAVFPVNNKKFAILGGNGSYSIYTITLDGPIEQTSKAVNGQGHTFVLDRCRVTLSQITETMHPCLFSRRNNKLFLLHFESKGLPTVVDFCVEDFDVKNNVDL